MATIGKRDVLGDGTAKVGGQRCFTLGGGSWVGRGGDGSAMVGGDRNDNQEECDGYNLQERKGRSHV